MNSALSAQVGERIRSLRKARKWSQADLGRLIGVHKVTVGQYESGDRSPSYDVLLKIADTFKVSTDYLLRGSESGRISMTGFSDEAISALAAFLSEVQNEKE